MKSRTTTLSTSEARRETVIRSAMEVFAAHGYLGTPIVDIAKHAKISPAYVFKLFPSKEELFVAALERCFELILAALRKGAEESAGQGADAILFSMGGAYAALIEDRTLLLLQIHALSAASVPEIARTFRKGIKTLTTFVKSRSKASDELVQSFMAYGQLCHLITILGLEKDSASWSRLLTHGIRHS